MVRNNDDAIRVADITAVVEDIVPVELQESWDNSGLIIGFEDRQVKKLLLCLEMDEDVADEASRIGAQMVITHHPLIFGGISSICDSEPTGRTIMKLLADGISVYSCHTPFDKVKGGNNDAIAEMLGLEKVRNLRGDTVASADKMAERKDEADIGRTGKLSEPMTCRQVLDIVSGQLGMSMRQLRFVGNMDREVETIGICTGAGADMMDMAVKAAGCQLFITGDVKYHEAREADQKGICIIDAGHYGTERFFASTMKNMLQKELKDVEIVVSEVTQEPFRML